MARKPARMVKSTTADENNRVVRMVSDGERSYRRRVCGGCPWRVDNAGDFPAEAFRISAHTAYDAAFETFGCHESGTEQPQTCAGFLLRNSANNIGARLARIDHATIAEPEEELFESYRAMAEANGVPADDPVLERCRSDWE